MFQAISFSFAILRRVLGDCFTSPNGDFDPARVFGYGFVVAAATVFLVLTVYETLTKGVFETEKFSLGVAAIASSIAAVAAGVLIKKSTEVPLDTTEKTITSTPMGTAATTVTATTEPPVKTPAA